MTVHARLRDEGSSAARPTPAENEGNELFRLLAAPNYDPDDEHWEFPPGSVVRCETRIAEDGKTYLLAVSLAPGA
jgi:hypothetical protein